MINIDTFEFTAGCVERRVCVADAVTTSAIPREREECEQSAVDAWDQLVLRGAQPRVIDGGNRGRMRIVDLFSGAGGLSLGACLGLRAAGYEPIVELAADLDDDALRIYDRNIAPHEVRSGPGNLHSPISGLPAH